MTEVSTEAGCRTPWICPDCGQFVVTIDGRRPLAHFGDDNAAVVEFVPYVDNDQANTIRAQKSADCCRVSPSVEESLGQVTPELNRTLAARARSPSCAEKGQF